MRSIVARLYKADYQLEDDQDISVSVFVAADCLEQALRLVKSHVALVRPDLPYLDVNSIAIVEDAIVVYQDHQ